MHGYAYKYEMNPVKGTIKLKPTRGTYLKALLPWAVISVVGWAVATALPEKPISMLDDLEQEMQNPENQE